MVIQKGVASKNTNPQCMWRSWTISLSHVVSTNIKENPATKRILILHPCMQEEPTLYNLFEQEEVSLVVTGSERV